MILLAFILSGSFSSLVEGSVARVLDRLVVVTDGILFEMGANAREHDGIVNRRATADFGNIMIGYDACGCQKYCAVVSDPIRMDTFLSSKRLQPVM